ncbi:MAG: hypothetical protein WC806_04830 [Candidatus Gracilibacteria bacterium]|jgi:hypothetical protein
MEKDKRYEFPADLQAKGSGMGTVDESALRNTDGFEDFDDGKPLTDDEIHNQADAYALKMEKIIRE